MGAWVVPILRLYPHDAELIGSSGDDATGCRYPPTSDEKWRNVVDIGQLGCERTCSTEKENLMASPTTFRSPYVQRLELVRDTIMSHSKLGDKAASELAEHVLHALNSIPEKVR